MKVEFSKPFADPKLVTSVGSWLAVPGTDSYELRFRGLGRYVRKRETPTGKAPQRLLGQFNSQVDGILEAGHLAPWVCNQEYRMDGYCSRDNPWLIHGNPAETLHFLAQAVPLLAPPKRKQTVEYLKRERRDYSPEKTALLLGGRGARRESYYLSEEFLLDKPPGVSNINHNRGMNFFLKWKVLPPENVFYLSEYYSLVEGEGLKPQLPSICSVLEPYLKRTDWATGSTFQWPGHFYVGAYSAGGLGRRNREPWFGNGGVVDINNRFLAAIGLVRLGRLAGDRDVETLGWGQLARNAALRFAVGKMTAHLYKTGTMTLGYSYYEPDNVAPAEEQTRPELDVRLPYVIDEYGMSFSARSKLPVHTKGLIALHNVTPELGAFLKDWLKDETERYFHAFETNLPEWYLAWAGVSLASESTRLWPHDSYQTFMAHALVLDSSPEWLEKHLDLPWQARGDLYYLQKLVETIRAYGR